MFLNNHTYYSLRYGTIAPKRLVELAKEHHFKTLVLTDINTTSACMDVVRLCCNENIKTVLGVDFRNGAQQQFIMLATSNTGFKNINSYLSSFLHQASFIIPQKAASLKETLVIYPFKNTIDFPLKPNEFIGIRKEELRKLPFSKWKNQLDKLVVLQTVTFEHKKGFNTHRLLRAIDTNVLLSKLPITQQASENDSVTALSELEKAFFEYPEILQNTHEILDRCSIQFEFSPEIPNNQKSFTQSEEEDYELLEKLAYNGVSYRYENANTSIYSRIEKELAIIKEKKFVSYF